MSPQNVNAWSSFEIKFDSTIRAWQGKTYEKSMSPALGLLNYPPQKIMFKVVILGNNLKMHWKNVSMALNLKV